MNQTVNAARKLGLYDLINSLPSSLSYERSVKHEIKVKMTNFLLHACLLLKRNIYARLYDSIFYSTFGQNLVKSGDTIAYRDLDYKCQR